MTESYPVFNPRQDEKFALHGCLEHSTALPRVRRPSHNDLRQILPSQFPREFSNSSISSGSGEVGLALEGRRDRPYVFTKCSMVWDEHREIGRSLKAQSMRRECEAS